jgi:hypothetical protein
LALPQETPASSDLVDLTSFFWVGMATTTFHSFVAHHPPIGTVETGGGTSGGPGLPTVLSLIFGLARPPAFAQLTELEYSFQAAPGGDTWVRLDAQLIWRPIRPAATLVPSTDQLAIARVAGTAFARESSIQLLQGASVTKLIATVNSEPTFPPGSIDCALVTREITVNFFARRSSRLANASLQVQVNCSSYKLRTPGGAVQLQSQPTVALLLRLLATGGAVSR